MRIPLRSFLCNLTNFLFFGHYLATATYNRTILYASENWTIQKKHNTIHAIERYLWKIAEKKGIELSNEEIRGMIKQEPMINKITKK